MSSSSQWKNDVFISFRGKDTRYNFMSHLFHRLSQAGIHCFRDDDREDAGKLLGSKIFNAIDQVRFALVVFSETYAESNWCLDELVKILRRRKDSTEDANKPGLMVIPIFYGMEPGEIWKLVGDTDNFRKALVGIPEDEGKKIRDWIKALKEAKSTTGYDLKKDANSDESMLIGIIVEHLVREVRKIRPLHFVKGAIGVDDLAKDVISLLNRGGKMGVRRVGIWGPEGIGKTTVAGVAFNRIRDEYNCSVFLAKIGEAGESGLVEMKNKLLQELGGQWHRGVIGTNSDEIKERMHGNKLLLVLDGVTDKNQVDDFGGGKPSDDKPMKMGEGSRILITTRERALLNVLEVDDKYIVRGLSRGVAHQLFWSHALETTEQDVKELSEDLTHYAGGHPLLLKRLGSYVSDGSITHWRKTLHKLVSSASSLSSLPSPTVGLYEGQRQRGGSHHGHGVSSAGVSQFTVRVESTSNSDSITIDCTKDGCLRSSKHSKYPAGETFPVKPDYANRYRTPFDSLGLDFGRSSCAYPFEFVGPFGVDDGTTPPNPKDWGYTDVRGIRVFEDGDSESKVIKDISIVYDEYGRPSDPILLGKFDEHGHPSKHIPHGTPRPIDFDYPSEYLTTISGHIQEASGRTIIRSLTFHTSKNHPMKFGKEEGKEFSFPYTGGKIVGFYGSFKDSYLESIGAFYEPIPHTYPIKVFGPFGCGGKKSWDLGDATSSETKAKLGSERAPRPVDIKSIDVRHDGSFIHSTDFVYDNGEGKIISVKHGGSGGETTLKYELGNGEYITSFAGYLDNANGRSTRINSLTFQTNKRIWGPIGREEGECFSLPSECGKVVGFFGTSSDFLESIGARVELYSRKLCSFKFVGLFGGKRGSMSEDSNQSTSEANIIYELDGAETPFIQSIRFWHKDNAETSEGARKKKIELDSDEYLSSISGYTYKPDSEDEELRITSLTFQTNKRTIGPIGVEKGSPFSSPVTGGKIVKVCRWSSEQKLRGIEAYFEPISELNPVKSVGPFGAGGRGQTNWKDDKYIAVREIDVTTDDNVLCIRFRYIQSGGKPVWSERYRIGTNEDHTKPTNITLEDPREYFTSISGYMHTISSGNQKDDNTTTIIQSLTFHSNKTSYGPFGKKDGGQYFWYPSSRSRIIGFFGTCEKREKILTSIGVYAEPIPNFYPFKNVGPFGGSGGTPWDDEVHTDVRGFYICYGKAIRAIQIDYDDSGSIVFGSEHGVAHQKNKKIKISLKFPMERLRSVSGVVMQKGDTRTIHDLEIVTTDDTYGPYAKITTQDDHTTHDKFFIPSEPGSGRIVGFFGRAESHLISIGARLEPC